MPSLKDQRRKITPEQRGLLDEIWSHFLSTRQWPDTWELNSRHHKPVVRRILQPLNDRIIVESNGGQNGGNCYQLQLLGALITTCGDDLEKLLVRYLEFLRNRYQTNPKKISVDGLEIQQALHLSDDETVLLGRLVDLGSLYSSSACFDRNGSTRDWSAGILKSVEDFPLTGDLHGELEKLVFRHSDRSGPVFMDDRQPVFSAQNHPSIFANRSENFIPLMKTSKASKLIFISHSSRDKDIAEAIVDLLCAALSLRRSDFMCTSVDGAKLPGGAYTDTVLRGHIRDLPAFLSLLTPDAVASTYVLFELGARWGNGLHHIPLLGKGAGSEVLKEPLKATNALNLSKEADVFQLVEDLAGVLEREAEATSSYIERVKKVVQISTEAKQNRKANVAQSGPPDASTVDPAVWHWKNEVLALVGEMKNTMKRGQIPSDWYPAIESDLPILNRVIFASPQTIDPRKRKKMQDLTTDLCRMPDTEIVHGAKKVFQMLTELETLIA